jgi:membrane-associated phospholipid phosphatase
VSARRFLIVWTAVAAATLLTSVGARLAPRDPGDLSLARTVQSVNVPLLGGVLHFENAVGSPRPAVSIIILVAVLLLAMRGPRLAIVFAGTNTLYGLDGLLKRLVDRPRPAAPLVRVAEKASGLSFPSGHVFSAVLLYGTIAVLLEVLPVRRARRRVLQAGCLVVILLMGPARVYVGAHWPSDVFGGYLWGVVLLLPAMGLARHAGWLSAVSRVDA